MSLLFGLAAFLLACSTSFAVAPAAAPPRKPESDPGPIDDAGDTGGETDDDDDQTPADDEEVTEIPSADDIKAAVKEGREGAAEGKNDKPDAKPAPKKPAPKADAETDDKDSGPDEKLLKRAADAGMSAERAKSLTSKALEAALDVVDQQTLEYGRKLRTGEAKEPDKKEAAPPPDKKDPPKAPAATGEAPNWPEKIEKLNFDELVDKEEQPETHAALSKLQDHVNGYLEKFHQAVTGLLKSHFETQEETAMGKFDTQIAGLGEDYAELLGVGPTNDLDTKSPQFALRKDIADAMGDMHRGRIARTGRAPKFDELFQFVIKTKLADHNKTTARKEVDKRVEDRQRRFTARPSHQAPRAKGKEDKAVDALIEKMSEMEAGE